MGKRFQTKKLNKDDHKDVKNTARAVRKGVGVVGAVALVTPVIKKHGKGVVDLAKNIILRS